MVLVNRKGAEDEGWHPLTIVAVLVGSLVVIVLGFLFFFGALGGLQQSFTDSICKFEVALRSVLVGNPVIQMLTGVFGFFTRGWTTVTAGMFSGLSLQSCMPGQSLQTTQAKPINSTGIDRLFKKIGDETARCWDLFGGGNWDSLLFSRGGLGFTCYEDSIYINCSMFNSLPVIVTSGDLHRYLGVHEYAFASYSKLYYDIFPEKMPVLANTTDIMFGCDDTLRKYLFTVTFVDKTLVPLGSGLVPLTTMTVNVDSLSGDTIYLSIIEIG